MCGTEKCQLTRITNQSKKVAFSHTYLPYKQAAAKYNNITIYCCDDKDPGLFMDVLQRCPHAHWFTTTRQSSKYSHIKRLGKK